LAGWLNVYSKNRSKKYGVFTVHYAKFFHLFTLTQHMCNFMAKWRVIFLSGLVMGPGQKLLTWVRSGQFFCGSSGVGSGWVIHLWFEFKFRKLPLKISNFSIFSLRVKKISSGQVKKYPGRRRVGLLFTAGQK